MSVQPKILTEPSMVKKNRRKKILLTLLYSSLALAGLLLGGLILFEPESGIDKGVFTALLIVLVDGYIIVGLFAKHRWLQVTMWAVAAVTLIFTILTIWLPSPYMDYVEINGELGVMPEPAWNVFVSNTAGVMNIAALNFAFLSLASLMFKKIVTLKPVRLTYYGMQGFTIVAVFLVAYSVYADSESIINLIATLYVFAATSGAIVTVGAVVSSVKTRQVTATNHAGVPVNANVQVWNGSVGDEEAWERWKLFKQRYDAEQTSLNLTNSRPLRGEIELQ